MATDRLATKGTESRFQMYVAYNSANYPLQMAIYVIGGNIY